ncbi:uncharacterized protein F4822DRAFT_430431 [Hypoxylon trugodes]|uniref:uncharacterized protein n=1 Tax=Hypoxylon trugodes TaxID=326681 RepID=UPI00219A4FD6|nr:uncharacterized protein F4822DRAFT_430431 [Hypoxylon trugodes]KAI1387685.1 hypothetical protein F4822DRAFT_430431 [Hypoxylon trugodes]
MAPNPVTFPPGYAEETAGPRSVRVAIAFIVLDIVVVALRFATRLTYKVKLGLDDYIIIPALIFSLGMCAVTILEVKIADVGHHLAVLAVREPDSLITWAKMGYAIEEIYCVAVALPKLSILASYLRIFTARSYRIATYMIGYIIVGTAIAGILTSLLSCRPFYARWNLDLAPTHCINIVRFWTGINVPSIATNIMMLILPWPTIWGLQIDKKQKIALSGIFVLASGGMVASIIRLITTLQMKAMTDDGTWKSADIELWSVVESSSYLIAACLPVLRPIYISVIDNAASLKRHLTSNTFDFSTTPSTENPKGFVYVEMDSYQKVESVRGEPKVIRPVVGIDCPSSVTTTIHSARSTPRKDMHKLTKSYGSEKELR